MLTFIRVVNGEAVLSVRDCVPIDVSLASVLQVVRGRIWVDSDAKANLKVNQDSMLVRSG